MTNDTNALLCGAVPEFFPGERVVYTNEHYASFGAVVTKAETRWVKRNEGYVFYHIKLDCGDKMTGVPSARMRPAKQIKEPQ